MFQYQHRERVVQFCCRFYNVTIFHWHISSRNPWTKLRFTIKIREDSAELGYSRSPIYYGDLFDVLPVVFNFSSPIVMLYWNDTIRHALSFFSVVAFHPSVGCHYYCYSRTYRRLINRLCQPRDVKGAIPFWRQMISVWWNKDTFFTLFFITQFCFVLPGVH